MCAPASKGGSNTASTPSKMVTGGTGAGSDRAEALLWADLQAQRQGFYRVCWCTSSCSDGSDFLVDIGTVQVFGPFGIQHAMKRVTTSTCHFEDEQSQACLQWNQDNASDALWQRHSGPTRSGPENRRRITGPKGASSGSYYVYIDSSQGDAGDQAFLLTNRTLGHGAQVSFSYYMFGQAVGSLRLQLRLAPSPWTDLWSAAGDHGEAWHAAAVDLSGFQGRDRELRFVGEAARAKSGVRFLRPPVFREAHRKSMILGDTPICSTRSDQRPDGKCSFHPRNCCI